MAAKSRMFLRLITSSFTKRRSRIAVILLAVVIGASVVSGLVSVYADIGAKMSGQMRTYGANVVVTPRKGSFVTERSIDRIARRFDDALVAYSPYLYGLTDVGARKMVVVGVRFDQLRRLSSFWKLQGSWPKKGTRQVLVGREMAKKLAVNVGDRVNLGPAATTVAAIIDTGGPEDNQLFAGLPLVQSRLGEYGQASVGYFSILGQGEELERLISRVAHQSPGFTVEPIRRISESEGRVLSRISALVLLVTAVIFATSLLCVTTTLIAIVIERRQEMALKKALGAYNQNIMAEFLGEGAVIGLAGGLLGWALGFAFAQWVGRSVFGSPVAFRAASVGAAVAVALVVTTAGSVVPVRLALGIAPAVVLKGE